MATVIKGRGFNPDGGGFSDIIVDGKVFTPEQIRAGLDAAERVEGLETVVPKGWKLVPLEPTDAMCGAIEYGAASRICETRREERLHFLRKAIAAALPPTASEVSK